MNDLGIMPRVQDLQPASASASASSIGGGTGGAGSGGRKPDDPARVRDAAQQFEALLMGQMLRSVREGTGNWLSTGEDSQGDCATDFAEQQFAAAMTQQGGLGLASLITDGLTR